MPARSYHEDLWSDVPPEGEPPQFASRLAFLRGHVVAGARVLDVGCGEGRFASALAAAGAQVTGIDVASEPLRRAAERDPSLELRLVEEAALAQGLLGVLFLLDGGAQSPAVRARG